MLGNLLQDFFLLNFIKYYNNIKTVHPNQKFLATIKWNKFVRFSYWTLDIVTYS